MSHPLYDVTGFEIIAPYTIRVWFDDDTEQIINFEPVLYGELYSPLRKLTLFEQVRLDEEHRNLIWPNDADFDPWMLHEWDRLADKLAAQAMAWNTVSQNV